MGGICLNHTEKIIEIAFAELLEEKPLSKITVKDIVERCGVNRNTFYYHFQDIPYLLEYTLKKEADWIIKNHCELGSAKDCLTLIVQFIIDHKNAAQHIYRSLNQEVFFHILEDVSFYTVTEYIENVTADIPIDAKDKDVLSRFYKCTLVGIILDWMNADMSYDLLEMFDRINTLYDGTAADVIIKKLNKKIT